MSVRPLGERVIVKADAAEETTASGLFLAHESQEKPQTGTVIAVGPGKMDNQGVIHPLDIKVGDKVIYGKYGGTEIRIEGQDLLILRGDDIFAVVE